MKKIIVAIDGLNYKPETVEFAITIANHLQGHLVGIFLHDRTYHSYKMYSVDAGKIMTDKEIEIAEAKDISLRKEAMQKFEDACKLRRRPFSIRENKNIALPELLHESIYADLLIVNSGEQFTHYIENRPSAFLRNLLEAVKCPVILAPDQYHVVKKAILLYDGTPESVHAIKTFCFIMDGFKNLQVEVLCVKQQSQSLHLPDNKLLKEYLKRHYPQAIYTVCKGDAEKKIPALIKKEEEEGTLVVSGAYNRGYISRWFRPSMADILLSTIKSPLFISPVR